MKVILVGGLGSWEAEKADAEIWCVNRTFRNQPNCDRVYAMDPIWPDEDLPLGISFVRDLNDQGVPLVTQRHYPEIPLSEPYDLEAADEFFGLRYYTSTMSYMMADAIRLGAEVIVLHRFLALRGSEEYLTQKPCLDFWAGQALGRGIKIVLSSDTSVCRPLSWQTDLYGYEMRRSHDAAVGTIASVMRGILHMDHTLMEDAFEQGHRDRRSMGRDEAGRALREPDVGGLDVQPVQHEQPAAC